MMAPPSMMEALCQRQRLERFLPIQWQRPLDASDDSETSAPQWRPLQQRQNIVASTMAQHWHLWWRGNTNSSTSLKQTTHMITAQPRTAPLMMTAFKRSVIPLLLRLGLQCCASNTVPSTLCVCLLLRLLSSSCFGYAILSLLESFCWSGWLSWRHQQWCLRIWYSHLRHCLQSTPQTTNHPICTWGYCNFASGCGFLLYAGGCIWVLGEEDVEQLLYL